MTNKSVGLILMTDAPNLGLVAVLRERGFFNFEKDTMESWTGACQVTVHGKLEEGEDFLAGLHREVTEEVGVDFASRFSSFILENPTAMIEVSHVTTDKKETMTFALKVDFAWLKTMRLGPESGAIRFANLAQTYDSSDIASFDKTAGIPDRTIIAMFHDEKEAVLNAFNLMR